MSLPDNSLPGGRLPDGDRPRIRGITRDELSRLLWLDRRQEERDGDVIDVGTVESLDETFVRLVGRGLVGVDPGEHTLAGVTPAGDRALERFGL